MKHAALELDFVDEATFDRVVDPNKMVKHYVASATTGTDRSLDDRRS